MAPPITVVGGGLAGLVASITCAEAGAPVRLYEAHATLGGRARGTGRPYVANEGPHVLYSDGPLWVWLAERDLVGPARGVPLRGGLGFYFRRHGRLRRVPPRAVLRFLPHARRTAPVDLDFRSWAAESFGEEAAPDLSNLLGVATFDHDPGRLSAAFVWERLVRIFTAVPPAARYVRGGWSSLIDRLERRARELGVQIETGSRVDRLPDPPVIVATSLPAARALLTGRGDPAAELTWESGATLLFDLALTRRRGDAFVVSDLDEAGWLERYSLPDPTLAPAGHSLIQAQLPLRPAETRAAGMDRMHRLLDLALPDWRQRAVWHRNAVARGRTGALDLPGYTWRDRPGIERGDGIFLAGDQVAAPGLLSEVAFTSAVTAATGALDRSRAVQRR
jgi:phytoene dehydrogenase-like protein